MAKEAKKSSGSKKETAPELEKYPIRSALKGVALLLFVGASVVGYLRMRDHVEKTDAFPAEPPRIILKDQPAWMSDTCANRIRAVARPEAAYSAFDHSVLVNTADLLKTQPEIAPWIKQVKSVRRVYDQGPGDAIEIDCEYRAPVAMVKWGDYFWLVDAEGILLPEQYTANDAQKVLYDKAGQVNLRIIDGVASGPAEAGQKWVGGDVQAGIDLAKLLHARPFADEIERISVANYAGRLDPKSPQLVLETKYQTQVWWGRPIYAKDFLVEVSPAQKLEYMAKIVQQFHRIDARHTWVDLRFDRVMYPSAEAPGAEANTNP